VFHSDQGVQYVSLEFRQALSRLKLVQSMSRKGGWLGRRTPAGAGSPRAAGIGASCESFFSSLKLELDLQSARGSKPETQLLVFERMEVFSNRQRPKPVRCYYQGQEAVALEPRISDAGGVRGESSGLRMLEPTKHWEAQVGVEILAGISTLADRRVVQAFPWSDLDHCRWLLCQRFCYSSCKTTVTTFRWVTNIAMIVGV
jgi:putative transposase